MTTLPDSSILSMSPETLQRFEVLLGRNIVVVIPAYNEERFIGSVVLKVKKFAETIIVVDDGSVDSTAEIAAEAGAVVVRHSLNQGKGVALNTGFRKALELSPEVVITIDADGQHLPEELPAIAAPVLNDEADLVIGSRYLEIHSDVPKKRVIGHRIFNWITETASGTKASDSQSGYRAFSPEALRKISFSSDSFSVESEMQFIATQHDLRLKEVPITILYKDAPKRSVWRHGMVVLNGILRLVGQYRPLFFFGLPGFFIMMFGFGWAAYVVEIFTRTKQLAVGYAIFSVLLSVVGMIGFATGIILHSVRSLIISLVESKK